MSYRFKKGSAYREIVDASIELSKALSEGTEEATYTMVKSFGEKRYTFGPLYLPNTYDAHGEWADPDDLQKAVWDYTDWENRDGFGMELRKQHGEERIGRIAEIVQWPFPLEAKLSVAGDVKKFSLPAGTVYTGVLWNEDAWPDVKSGAITGLSMGGRAVRVAEPAPGLFE